MAVFPRVVVKNSKGWDGCSQRRSALLHSKVRLGVFVWVLWHQTGAQYSAGANTSAEVEVRKVSNEVPQLVPDSFLTSATRKDTFCFSMSKWFLYVRLRSRVIPCNSDHVGLLIKTESIQKERTISQTIISNF